MGLFEHFPYTNFQDLNLDYLLNLYNKLFAYYTDLKNNIVPEINNKLQIIEEALEALRSGKFLLFDTAVEMKQYSFITPCIAVTKGFYTAGDQGNGIYMITNTAMEDLPELSIESDYKCYPFYSYYINPLTFGVKNDGDNPPGETNSEIINYLTWYADLKFPTGTYRISETLFLRNTISGEEAARFHQTGAVLLFTGIEGEAVIDDGLSESSFTIHDISIDVNHKSIDGIRQTALSGGVGKIYNVSVKNCCGSGIHIMDKVTMTSRTIVINDVFVMGSDERYSLNTGIDIGRNNNDIMMTNIECMRCCKGIFNQSAIIRANNVHLNCLSPALTYDHNYFVETRGIFTTNCFIGSDIYLDSYYAGFTNAYNISSLSNVVILMDIGFISESNIAIGIDTRSGARTAINNLLIYNSDPFIRFIAEADPGSTQIYGMLIANQVSDDKPGCLALFDKTNRNTFYCNPAIASGVYTEIARIRKQSFRAVMLRVNIQNEVVIIKSNNDGISRSFDISGATLYYKDNGNYISIYASNIAASTVTALTRTDYQGAAYDFGSMLSFVPDTQNDDTGLTTIPLES